ncbi:MAG: flagellar hook-basal body complex protein FliE [Betaproteobacteria bacterium]|jgi:flagellar hook-basal body complex protein FliE|nr:flagellar hook-basal body complex protein FliE [Betaproteobacteria bacterium]
MAPLQAIGAGNFLVERSKGFEQLSGAKLGTPDRAAATTDGGFIDAIGGALDKVSQLQANSSGLSKEFQMENPDVGLEETMIAMQKASLGFQAAVQVRNKVVQAYNDIMNMNV